MPRKNSKEQQLSDHIKKFQKQIKDFRQYLEEEQLAPETIKSYMYNFQQYITDVKKGNPETTTYNDIVAYRRYCVKKGYKKSALVNKYASLRRYCTYICEHRELLSSKEHRRIKDIIKIRKFKGKTVKPLTYEQVEQVFAIAKNRSPRDHAIFRVMYEGCLRRMELCSLKISDFDYKDKKMKVEGIKREDDRFIRLSQECCDAIKEYIEEYREKPFDEFSDYLFINNRWKMTKTRLFELNKEYKQRADLPDEFTLHGWRHTGITHIVKKAMKQTGQNIPLTLANVQRQTGHKDVNVLMNKYVHVNDEERKKLFDQIWDDEEKKKPDEPEPEEPEPKKKPKPDPEPMYQKPQTDHTLKEQLTQRFIRGEISESSYLVALKSLDGTKNQSVGYQ